jgi:hypothetical protein
MVSPRAPAVRRCLLTLHPAVCAARPMYDTCARLRSPRHRHASRTADRRHSARRTAAATPHRSRRRGQHETGCARTQPDAQHAVQRARQPCTERQPAHIYKRLSKARRLHCRSLADAFQMLPQLRHDELSRFGRSHSRSRIRSGRSPCMARVRTDGRTLLPAAKYRHGQSLSVRRSPEPSVRRPRPPPRVFACTACKKEVCQDPTKYDLFDGHMLTTAQADGDMMRKRRRHARPRSAEPSYQ